MEVSEWMTDAEAFESEYEFREIEGWMLNPAAFAKPEVREETINFNAFLLEDYDEEIIPVEPWMLSTESYDLNYFEADYEEEILPIEDWMLNF